MGSWGASWAVLATSSGVLAASWGVLGASWAALGSSWGVLAASWDVLGGSWCILGVHGSTFVVLSFLGRTEAQAKMALELRLPMFQRFFEVRLGRVGGERGGVVTRPSGG